MAKSGPRSTGGGDERGSARCEGLVDAAFETLREEGYARTSARAIASRAGCNSALIFYYFDSVNDLLVEALARSSRTQLDKYEEALAEVNSIEGLVTSVRSRLRDDMASGHVKVLAELIGASSSDEHLRAAIFSQVTPWMALTEKSLGRILSASGLGQLVPPKQLSFVVVSLVLGMELLADVAGDDDTMDQLFESAHTLAGLLSAFDTAGVTG